MAETKTKKTAVSVESFLSKVASAEQRADAHALIAMMKEITGAEPRMWGPSMVGFGDFHYKYDSGHEGDIFLAGFSPRKAALTIYLYAGFEGECGALVKKLGKCKTSKGCLYIKKLADIDAKVLRELIAANIRRLEAIQKSKKKA